MSVVQLYVESVLLSFIVYTCFTFELFVISSNSVRLQPKKFCLKFAKISTCSPQSPEDQRVASSKASCTQKTTSTNTLLIEDISDDKRDQDFKHEFNELDSTKDTDEGPIMNTDPRDPLWRLAATIGSTLSSEDQELINTWDQEDVIE